MDPWVRHAEFWLLVLTVIRAFVYPFRDHSGSIRLLFCTLLFFGGVFVLAHLSNDPLGQIAQMLFVAFLLGILISKPSAAVEEGESREPLGKGIPGQHPAHPPEDRP